MPFTIPYRREFSVFKKIFSGPWSVVRGQLFVVPTLLRGNATASMTPKSDKFSNLLLISSCSFDIIKRQWRAADCLDFPALTIYF